MLNVIAKVNGWKTILAYVVAQVGGSYPLVLGAYLAWKAAPSDPQAIANLVAQLGLVVGVGHKLVKNVQAMLKGKAPA
ncbi:MAG: hypothetical protein EB060_11625 [Proteobacteria bacterium]|nr:hypothetical protein [Pseudomonadota bacterium]